MSLDMHVYLAAALGLIELFLILATIAAIIYKEPEIAVASFCAFVLVIAIGKAFGILNGIGG